ncbi:MAG TPA: outer membrane beta-barrel family protein [Chitinophagaceae bacterium]|nr:outer membrane beta-barrel family protein [Chitinophagaceae bacterium]
MNKLVLALLVNLTSFCLFAQNPMMQRPAGAGNGQQMTGRMYGKIVEAQTGKAVDAASVQLVQNRMDTVTKKRKDVVINGMLTKANGEFSLENVPLFGQYKLKITAIGLKPLEQTVGFEMKMKPGNADMSAMLNAIDKDLGNIKMEVDAQVLGNVTITSSKPLFQLDIDRKIYNVEKDVVSTGGTAVDVMKNVPSLSVDLDGNVTLRNNAPQIFVDGRPTTMQLEQIPADAIESIEIITNPSAKYDASGGTSGILNIVLKKNKKVGYNGGLRSSIDSRAKVGLGADFNLRQNKVNFFGSANINQRKSISTGWTERTNILDQPNTVLHQDDTSESPGHFKFFRAGIDYFMDNRNTLTVSGSLGGGKFDPETTSDLLVDSLYTVKKTSYLERLTNSTSDFKFRGAQVSFKHNFPKAGREWTSDITYNKRTNINESLIETDYYDYPSNSILQKYLQQQNASGSGESIVWQTDFVNPISDKSKIEMGLRAAFNNASSTSAFYTVDPITGESKLQPESEIDYESENHVLAAYTTYSNKVKNFGYQVGLRVESSGYDGQLLKTNESFSNSFPLSLFPSVFLSQKLEKDQDLQFNYTRRINRPNFFQLTPFTDSSDFLNLRKGNPDLEPEFTNSFEASYQKIFKNKDNFLASAYYKRTENLITVYQEQFTSPVNGKDYIMNTYINANSSYVTGLEFTMKNKITKWWDLTSNLNLYTSKISLDDPSVPEQDQFASWFGKVNNLFKLPKNFSFQLSGEYNSKTVLPPGGSSSRGGGGGMMYGGPVSNSQGYVRANYFVDMGVRYEFLKNKAASISLNMSDVFRTRRSYTHSETQFFTQDVFRRRDPQMMRLNFNWRFGKFDPNLFKRKNMKGEREGMDTGDIMQ